HRPRSDVAQTRALRKARARRARAGLLPRDHAQRNRECVSRSTASRSIIVRMDTFSPAEAPAAPSQRTRDQIEDRFKWNLSHIFPDWDAWQRGYDELDKKITQYASLQGTLKQGPDQLLRALTLADELGQLEYKVWYLPSLKYDEDQRDNTINGRR